MKKIEYICDLCHSSHTVTDNSLSLIGLYWVDFPIRGWIQKPERETEHHICRDCLKSLQIIGDNKKPAMEERK